MTNRNQATSKNQLQIIKIPPLNHMQDFSHNVKFKYNMH